MAFYTQPTFQKLTAPGYFNFSETQKPYTTKMVNWFNLHESRWASQVNLFDSFFRLWMTHDYSTATVSRTPYVAYLLNQYGLSWFLGTDTQAVALIAYVMRSYPMSTAANILYLFSVISAQPFLWSTGNPQIIYGSQIPAKYAEIFIIYGTSSSTPSATTYAQRAWTPPAGWATAATTSTYYSYGYLSGGNIVWMTPQLMSAAVSNYEVANLAALPGAPATASTAGVTNDATGDVGARYYYDGSVWRKVSSPNANQGQVTTVIPTPKPSLVWAPNSPGPSITSETPPPAGGDSQGYGMYGGWGDFTLRAREIDLVVTLTPAGVTNLGIIVNLLRRVKPTLNRLIMYYDIQGVTTTQTRLEIKDSGSVA